MRFYTLLGTFKGEKRKERKTDREREGGATKDNKRKETEKMKWNKDKQSQRNKKRIRINQTTKNQQKRNNVHGKSLDRPHSSALFPVARDRNYYNTDATLYYS